VFARLRRIHHISFVSLVQALKPNSNHSHVNCGGEMGCQKRVRLLLFSRSNYNLFIGPEAKTRTARDYGFA
jgi:hypothetical protein